MFSAVAGGGGLLGRVALGDSEAFVLIDGQLSDFSFKAFL